MKNKKGQIYVVVLYVMALLMIGLTMSILMKPMKITYDQVYNETEVQADEYQQFFQRSVTFWQWTPLIIAIALIAWMYIKANERRDN